VPADVDVEAGDNITVFVEQVRARRAAAGRPEKTEAESVYRTLAGLLARGTAPGEPEAVQALARSSTTTTETGGRDE
jgi:hypothetical protein